MARARNADGFQQRVALDRFGEPISPNMGPKGIMHMSGRAVVTGPGMEPVPDLGPVTWYEADAVSVRRDLDPWEHLQLFNMWLLNQGKEFAIRCSPEAYRTLPGDVRRHFQPRHKTPPA